jgi:ADP-heptose:LPS heptosyltransferase
MQILILSLQKLGDFIQSTPLIATLREKYPRSDISVLFKDPSVEMASKLFFPEILTIKLDPTDSSKSLGLLPQVDILLNLSIDSKNLELVSLIKAKEVLGPKKVKSELIIPPLQNLALASMKINRRLGAFNLVDIWRNLVSSAQKSLSKPKTLGLSEKFQGLIERNKESGLPLIALHLGAGGKLRRYPVESMVEAIREISNYHPPHLILLGTRGERALSLKFIKLWESYDIEGLCENLSGETSLSELATILKEVKLLISSDTGVSHLGAAVDAPLLTLFFGPALSHETAPYSGKLRVLQGLAPCGPCTENLGCQRANCLALPTPKMVSDLILRSLSITPKENSPNIKDSESLFESYEGKLPGTLFRLSPTLPYRAYLTDLSLTSLIIKMAAECLINGEKRTGDLLLPDTEKYHPYENTFSFKTIKSVLSFVAKQGIGNKLQRKEFLDTSLHLLGTFMN